MFIKAIQKIAATRWYLICFIILITAFFTQQAHEKLFDPEGNLMVDSSIEPFMSRGEGGYEYFKAVREIFGSEEMLVVALQPQDSDPWHLNFFLMLEELTNELKTGVPGVKNVNSLTNAPRVTGICAGKPFFAVETIGSTCESILADYKNQIHCLQNKEQYQSAVVASDPEIRAPDLNDMELDIGMDDDEGGYGEEETETAISANTNFCTPDIFTKTEQQIYEEKDQQAQEIFEELKKHTLIHKDLLSTDFRTVALAVEFDTSAAPGKSETQNKVHELLEKYKTDDLKIAYTAKSRDEYLSSITLSSDLGRILPLSILLMMITLFVAFKSIRGVMIPVLLAVLGIVWTFGFLAFVGGELNTVTMILPPMLISVGSAYIIHMVNQYYVEIQHNTGNTPFQITQDLIQHLTVPLMASVLTTVVGFAALLSSPIPAVKEMGMWSSFGVMSIIFLTLTLAPAILSMLKLVKINALKEDEVSATPTLLDRSLAWQASVMGKYSKKYVMVWAVLGGIFAIGMLSLSVNSQFKDFHETTPIEIDRKLIQTELAGTDTLRLVFSGKHTQQDLQTAETMYGLMKLKKFILQQDSANEIQHLDLKIEKVYTPVEYLDIYRNGMDTLKDEEVVTFFKDSVKRNFPKYLSDDQKLLQVNIRMILNGTSSLLELRKIIEQKVPEYLPKLDVKFTGSVVLNSETADNIASGQVQSITIALIAIFVIMSVTFFSIKIGILALYPNLIPIAMFFGTLGFLDISISVTISIIASIALGLGVDDTIHFIVHHHEKSKKYRNEKKASELTLKELGKASVFTTVSLSLGFVVFYFGHMESQQMFGVLTAYTLVICLLTDMTFTPAMMMNTKIITIFDYVGMQLDEAFLKGLELFRNMTPRDIKLATLSAYTVNLEAGEFLYHEHDDGNEAYVVIKGQMELFLSEESHQERTLITRVDQGGVFGVRGLFRKAKRNSEAVALEYTELLVLNEKILSDLQKKYPTTATRLFKNFAITLASPITRAERSLAFRMAQVLANFEGDEQAYNDFLIKMVDDIAADGNLSPDERQSIESLIYADGKVTAVEQEQLDRLNQLISSGALKEERTIKDMVDEIVEDGVISPQERRDLNKAMYADHYVSPEEQVQIDRLQKLIDEGKVVEQKGAFDTIFQNMTQAQIRWLTHHFEVKHLPANVQIFTEKEYGDYMLVLKKGKFTMHVEEKGVNTNIATIFEGDVIGAASILTGNYIRTSGASTLEEAEVIFMSMKGIQHLEKHNVKLAAQFYFNMVCMMSDRLESCMNELYG
ncbi:MAG: MMPL family transporter [SAR324 cluster bacterium]|nr:MMPL family transporter [SAR324 cluster bacterium]